MIYSGHYKLNECICARDWLDIHKVFTNKEIFDSIVGAFVSRIHKNMGTYKIIGIGFHGLMLASSIGFLTNNAFTYVIQRNKQNDFAMQENSINTLEDTKIILVTDVIVTGSTLIDVIKDLKERTNLDEENIELVLSVFLRHPLGYGEKIKSVRDNEFFKKYEDRVCYLNDEISTEICQKKRNECFFQNQDINLYK